MVASTRTATRARVSLALVLAVLRLGACSSPEDLAAASAARGAGSTVGRCVDGFNATGGACVPGALDPFATPAPTLAWLLDAASSATARVPREDWRDGLGFAEKDPPASDAEVAALLALDDAAFAAVPARERRRAVTASARHAWRGYREHAWPSDELAPVARKGVAWLDVGLTIVDALDTLLILGLEDEAGEARDWIASPALAFDADKNANVFESTIRVLGGLAAARELGGDTERGDLLAKALDLAEKLSPAFKTRTGIPIMDVNFKTGDPHHPKWTQKSSLAEAGTLVLEWEALEAALRAAENKTAGGGEDASVDDAGDFGEAEMEYGFCPDGGGLKEYPIDPSVDEPSCDADEKNEENAHTNYAKQKTFARSTLAALAGRRYRRDIADGARRAFHAVTDATWDPANDGLVPNAVSSGTAKFDRASTLTLGARGDSYYEYLLKHWLHAGKPAGGERSYLRAMDGVLLYLLRRSAGEENAAVQNADARERAANALGLRWGVTEPAPRATSSARRRRRRWFDAEDDRRSDAEEKARVDAEGGVPADVEEAASAAFGVSTATTAAETTALPVSTVPNALESENKRFGLLYVAERVGGVGGTLVHKMDHLVCFLPGVLALGHLEGLGKRWGAGDAARERLAGDALERLGFARDAGHLDVAVELARTCVSMYTRTPAGLAPEIAHFPASGLNAGGAGEERVHAFGDLLVKKKDAHNLLRPETVESLFVLWRVTRLEEWRDAGWAMWRAWERHARVDTGGYAGVDSVVDPELKSSSSVLSDSLNRDVHKDDSSKLDANSRRRSSERRASIRRELNRVDKMESFWLSETLKYLFLLFTDDPTVTPLECFVFNTEAHPLPVLRAGVSDARACVERVAARHVRSLAAMQGVETEGRSFA